MKLIKGEYKHNFKVLIDMLRNDNIKLDMELYQIDDEGRTDETVHECKTSGCILGHSLRRMEKKEFYSLMEENPSQIDFYKEYSNEYFTKDCFTVESKTWSFLFGTSWCNDKAFAIKRIQSYIDSELDIHKMLGLDHRNRIEDAEYYENEFILKMHTENQEL